MESGPDLNLLPPAGLNIPLWRSLAREFRDRFAPDRLPPLVLTSRPVDTGMLVGDVISLPWFRTVFTNLGDVISPETLPPLELESRPVDVGELLGDQLSHGWWTSLVRNLADVVSPERLPPLYLTSQPVNPELASNELLVPRWSALLTTPKVFLPDKPAAEFERRLAAPARPVAPPDRLRAEADFVRELTLQKRRSLHRSHVREGIWISLAVLEAGFLIVWQFFPQVPAALFR